MAQSGEKKQKKYEVENKADVSLYLKEVCSTREPILEGHGCKDMSKAWSIFGFHRKYFVLYEGILLYYDHKSSYFKDRTKGLVSDCKIHFLAKCSYYIGTIVIVSFKT